jgi:hypothetical protein
MPRTCGLCGSSAVSHLAWCLRWIAAHSLVTMPVVSHSQKRKKWLAMGQVEGAMGLVAVQKDGDGGDGDVGQGQGDEHVAPPGKIE